MAFSLIRICRRNPVNCLSNELFANDYSLTCRNILLRNNFLAVPLNHKSNSFSNKCFKDLTETSSRNLCNGGNRNYFTTSVATVTSSGCPLRKFLPSNLQTEPELLIKLYSTASNDCNPSELSNKDKLKRAIKEYGATVVIFHVSISLLSLGCCYLAVTSGLNLGDYVGGLGGSNEVATEAGLFVVAYAVHKVFAPVRIGITLAATPIIVRYLRKINVLKPPKSACKKPD